MKRIDPPPTSGRFCYYVPADSYIKGHGYRASIVFENEDGHRPTGTWPYEGKRGQTMPYFWGHDLKDAEVVADEMNRRLGLSQEDVNEIINSSMMSSLKRRTRKGRRR